MNCIKLTLVVGAVLLLLGGGAVEAKKRRKSSSSKTKTKTKWSTSTELQGGDDGALRGLTPVVTSEEHGYYVKRTYLPVNASNGDAASTTTSLAAARQSPPFLAIPIAWFPTGGGQPLPQGNALTLNGQMQTLSEGFLCDDDCFEPYTPICGRTQFEVAVFYNKCKLNVAKCRSHGLWQDYAYDECCAAYPKEVAHAEQKFRASPFFREAEQPLAPEVEKEAIVNIAMEALSEIDHKLAEAEAEAEEHKIVAINANANNSNNNNNGKKMDKQEASMEKGVMHGVEKVPSKGVENETEKLVVI